MAGSANFTGGGLFDNVEAGILLESGEEIGQARALFDALWQSDDCSAADDATLEKWAEERRARAKLVRRAARADEKPDAEEDASILEAFVCGWIDIGVGAKTAGGAGQVVGELWRGWYVIPDQGEIDDAIIKRLSDICRVIAGQPGGRLNVSKGAESGPALSRILEITTAHLKRASRKMTPRELFVRQEKNYLVQLGFAHPGRGEIVLSRHGLDLADARDVAGMKRVYTEALEGCKHNGLEMLKFTRRLLARTGRLDFVEFSFFVCHAWAPDEADAVASMVNIYRRLPEARRRGFVAKMEARFAEKLEPTAKGVRMNYDKKVRHTMSALGWCEGLRYDPARKEIHMEDEE